MNQSAKEIPDYRLPLIGMAVLPFALPFAPMAEDIIAVSGAFVICGILFLIRYFNSLHADKHRLLKFAGPFLAVAALFLWVIYPPSVMDGKGYVVAGACAFISIFFIWGMTAYSLLWKRDS